MIQQKLVNEISLNFPELFFTGKYVNIRFKNKVSPFYFLSYRDQKIRNITNIERKGLFCLHPWFHFYGVSGAKTNLHNNYMI